MQAVLERLLVASSSSDPFSVIVVDPRTGVASWSYKGSELQGAAVGHVEPLGIDGNHIILSVKDRPLIHAIAVHPRDRYHQKSVVSGVITTFCTDRDGSLLFAAVGTQVFTWLLLSGELLSVIDAHYQAITQIALSADDSLLFTVSSDGSVNVYLVTDVVSQERDQTVEPLRKWRAHSLDVKGLYVSRNCNPRIVSCGLDHLALIHSISLDDVLLKISADQPLTACVLDAAESRLFLGSDIGNIAIINLYSLESVREILIQVSDENNDKVPVLNGHCDEITALSINSDGSLLASGDIAGKYCIWDIISRQCLKVSSMRGPISTLRFVPNWASITASEHVSLHPTFNLQRNTTKGEKIYIRPCDGNDEDSKFWREEANRLFESTLREIKASEQNGGKSKTKAKKKKQANILVKDDDLDIIVLDEDRGSSREHCPSCSSGVSIPKEAQELIEKQRQEILKLKRINAELYSFMAKEVTEK